MKLKIGKQYTKSMKQKADSFPKINKIDMQDDKNKREKKANNHYQEYQYDSTAIKKVIRKYYEHFYAHKFNNFKKCTNFRKWPSKVTKVQPRLNRQSE